MTSTPNKNVLQQALLASRRCPPLYSHRPQGAGATPIPCVHSNPPLQSCMIVVVTTRAHAYTPSNGVFLFRCL